MVMRKIITINEEKCNGCGNCITGCAEGALQLVNGKAKLVKETYCDGFGDCIGTCPTGALKIEERETEAFDIQKTYEHVNNIRGIDSAEKMKASFKKHVESSLKASPGSSASLSGCSQHGCPGTMARSLNRNASQLSGPLNTFNPAQQNPGQEMENHVQVIRPEISQWPVQLHLVPSKAEFFEGKELVIVSTCSPVSCPDIQWKYIRGRAIVTACPKLDRTDGYIQKLAGIFAENNIPRAIILRMEVPCCSGLTQIVMQALKLSERGNSLIIDEVWIKVSGEIYKTVRLNEIKKCSTIDKVKNMKTK
jgi:ferredoxin